MNKYCIWCEKPIVDERKNNKMYCSDKCFGNRHTADGGPQERGFRPGRIQRPPQRSARTGTAGRRTALGSATFSRLRRRLPKNNGRCKLPIKLPIFPSSTQVQRWHTLHN